MKIRRRRRTRRRRPRKPRRRPRRPRRRRKRPLTKPPRPSRRLRRTPTRPRLLTKPRSLSTIKGRQPSPLLTPRPLQATALATSSTWTIRSTCRAPAKVVLLAAITWTTASTCRAKVAATVPPPPAAVPVVTWTTRSTSRAPEALHSPEAQVASGTTPSTCRAAATSLALPMARPVALSTTKSTWTTPSSCRVLVAAPPTTSSTWTTANTCRALALEAARPPQQEAPASSLPMPMLPPLRQPMAVRLLLVELTTRSTWTTRSIWEPAAAAAAALDPWTTSSSWTTKSTWEALVPAAPLLATTSSTWTTRSTWAALALRVVPSLVLPSLPPLLTRRLQAMQDPWTTNSSWTTRSTWVVLALVHLSRAEPAISRITRSTWEPVPTLEQASSPRRMPPKLTTALPLQMHPARAVTSQTTRSTCREVTTRSTWTTRST